MKYLKFSKKLRRFNQTRRHVQRTVEQSQSSLKLCTNLNGDNWNISNT